MEESGGHYTEWNKPGTEKQMLYDITYIWNLKQVDLIEQRIETWLQEAGKKREGSGKRKYYLKDMKPQTGGISVTISVEQFIIMY